MTEPNVQFEIPEASATPKDMRALLLGQLLAYLDDEIENTDPEYVYEENLVGRTPSPYWRAKIRVDALRPIRGSVRRMLRTIEEQMVFDREISGLSPPRQTELECARHRDTCTTCTDHDQVIHRMQRDHRGVDEALLILVEGIGNIITAIEVDKETARTGDEPIATVPAIAKELRRTQEAAQKRRLRREKAS